MTWTSLIDIERPEELSDDKKGDENTLMKTTTEDFKSKTVFLVVYQGGSHDMMKAKLNKLCDSFGASK